MTRRNILLGGGALALAGAGAFYATMRKMGTLDEYEASVAARRAALRQSPEIGEFVRFATLAASGHNTQPWTFRVRENRVDIFPDFSRRTPVVDPDHHLFVSLGCAAENLALASGARGRPGELRFDPSNEGSVVFEFGNGPSDVSALFEAIPKRQSSRTEYDGKPINVADLQKLTVAAAIPGIDVILLTERVQMDRIRDLVIAGNTAQIANAAFITELKKWLRFSPRQAIETGDGLFGASGGSPILPAWLGPYLFDLLFKAGAGNDKYARQIQSSGGIAVFISARADTEHWVRAGRASQRFALQATALGLKCAFVNQPVEVAGLRPELAALVGMTGRRPDLVTRFGHGPALPFSARRPVEAVWA